MLDGVLEDDAERAHAAEIVHQEAERMRALVEDLLYLSQIEAGQLPLTLEPVALDDVVAAAAQRFRYQAETASVTVRQALDGAPVLADERRLEQVLANLLDNAIRYAPAGSEVLLRTARVPGSVLIEVHNGGEPIPPEDLPRVFDRFYQVDRARTRAGHSGLGLAIVRELVQAHGGEISVQSTREAGTVFTVRLPAVPAATPATGRPIARRDEPERGPAGASAST
jgi:signal transduction histidine kinase